MTDVTNEEKEFDDAFSEAAKKKAPAAEPDPIEDELPDPEPTLDPEPEDPYAGLPEAAAQRMRELEEQNQKLEHRIKSDDGRVAAFQRQIADMQQQMAAKAEAADPGGDNPSADDIAEAMGDEDSWSEFTEEYPEIAAAIESRLDRSIGEVENKITQRIAPVEKLAADATIDEGYRFLDEHHEGWRDRVASPDFGEWIETQPDVVKNWANSDDPQEASSLIQYFDNYLEASGKMADFRQGAAGTPHDEGDEGQSSALERKRKQQLEDGDAIRGSGAGIQLDESPGGDFENAFKVFASRKERQRQRA